MGKIRGSGTENERYRYQVLAFPVRLSNTLTRYPLAGLSGDWFCPVACDDPYCVSEVSPVQDTVGSFIAAYPWNRMSPTIPARPITYGSLSFLK